MKKIILGIFLTLTACTKTAPITVPTPPAADSANNVCVVSQYLGTNSNDPDCDFDSTFSTSDGTNAVAGMEGTLTKGLNGEKYAVIDGQYQLYNINSCSQVDSNGVTRSNLDAGYYALLAWVKYDCRGAAVNTVTFGPYPSGVLDSQAATLQATVIANNPGYSIAYTAYEPIGTGSNLNYIIFYIYKPTTIVDSTGKKVISNPLQGAIVDALKNAKTINTLFGNGTRSLSDTLAIAKQYYPAMANSESAQFASDMLTVQRVMRMRTTKLLYSKRGRKSSNRVTPVQVRVPFVP